MVRAGLRLHLEWRFQIPSSRSRSRSRRRRREKLGAKSESAQNWAQTFAGGRQKPIASRRQNFGRGRRNFGRGRSVQKVGIFAESRNFGRGRRWNFSARFRRDFDAWSVFAVRRSSRRRNFSRGRRWAFGRGRVASDFSRAISISVVLVASWSRRQRVRGRSNQNSARKRVASRI